MDDMKTLLIRSLLFLVVTSGLLAVVIVIRFATVTSEARPGGVPAPFSFDEAAAWTRLAGVLQEPGPAGERLREAFSGLHQALQVEAVAGGSLLVTWEGSNPALAPVLFVGHYGWSWGGEAEGELRGPGVLDGAAPVMAMLEAVEGLLAQGFEPERTILVAVVAESGASEVGGGTAAAAAHTAGLLEARDLRPEWILAPGGAVTTGMLPGLRDPVGLVGIAEKGLVVLELRASGEGGVDPGFPSSERTERDEPTTGSTPEGVLDRALERLSGDLFAPRIAGPTRQLVDALTPHVDPGTRMLASNLWLFEGPVARTIAGMGPAEELVRTTVRTIERTSGPTVGPAGGRKEQGGAVVAEARILVELRLAPWDSVEGAVARVRERLEDLPVEVRVAEDGFPVIEAGPSSSTAALGWELIRGAVHRVFADVAVVVPSVAPAPTAGRHFRALAGDVYHFVPFRADRETMERMGGPDEGITASAYRDMVRFYAELVQTGAAANAYD